MFSAIASVFGRPWRQRPVGGSPVFRALLIGTLCLPVPAWGQQLDFEVDNVSLQQIVAPRSVAPDAPTLTGGMAPTGSDVLVLQQGLENTAATYVEASPGGAIATLQLGQANTAVAVIKDSPGSVLAQAQIGTGTTSAVGVIGGNDNAVATAQIGHGLGVAVGLVDSQETTITYGQAGQNYSGGVVIKNAPPGTVIHLN